MENTDMPMMTDYSTPDPVANPANAVALPIFAALALLVTYLPLRSFYHVKNVAACSIILVLDTVNLLTLINAVIWPSDDWESWWLGYGLCDIEVLLRFPITMALATSLCCLSKSLADALDTEHAVFNQSKAQRRRKLIGEVLFCWAVPVLQMALHYTVQAGRYMIAPVFGCTDRLDNSWPMIVIIIMWCPIFTLLNVYYAILMITRLYKHRRTISSALSSTGSGLPPRKFVKLAIISIFFIVIYSPIQSAMVWSATPKTFVPYSWSRVHNPATWDPILFVHTADDPTLQWSVGWCGVVTAFFMFAFFGFNDDAMDTYRSWLVCIGAGKIWPSLMLTREQRRGSASGSMVMGSQSSFIDRLDLVSKVMKYLDSGSRKSSRSTEGTMVGEGSIIMSSRKGSQTTFDVSLAHSSTLSEDSLPYDKNNIAAPEPLAPATLPTRQNHGILSVFRTHLNLPGSLFTTASSSNTSAHNNPTWPRRTSSIPTQDATISTNIWSSPIPFQEPLCSTFPFRNTQPTLPRNPSQSHDDPYSPKLGTRAYRERERRELKSANEQERKAQADSTRQDRGMRGERRDSAAMSGVVKTTRLERREEKKDDVSAISLL